jgi:hypothetical protein
MREILEEISSVHRTAQLLRTGSGPVYADYCARLYI